MAIVGGCKKSDVPPPIAIPVAFSPKDLNADGTLNDKAIAELQGKSSEKALAVAFFRANLSDAGLAQMASFKNIHRIDAIGSRITQEGIDKLKKSLPEVEVAH